MEGALERPAASTVFERGTARVQRACKRVLCDSSRISDAARFAADGDDIVSSRRSFAGQMATVRKMTLSHLFRSGGTVHRRSMIFVTFGLLAAGVLAAQAPTQAPRK